MIYSKHATEGNPLGLAANTELDLYPCYKVVHTDGRIGGHNGGVSEKIRRLSEDGIEVVDGMVDLGRFGVEF